jgi:hypothetical protein
MQSEFKIIVLSLLVPVLLYGGLKGTVSDPRDLIVSGAIVTLTCGGHDRSVTTDSQGRFMFAEKAISGDCVISVNRRGFAPFHETVDPDTETLSVRLSLAVISQSVTVVADADPLLSPSLASVSLSHNELENISDDTGELIRYAKMLAGATTGTDVVYVDGLPSSVLPPAEMVARITVNGDPFSAEYADGDFTHIEITTRSADRRFRYGFGGFSLGTGGRNPLGPSLATRSRSGNGYISGSVPHLPLTFSFHGTLMSRLTQQPILAVLPPVPAFASDRGLRAFPISNHNGSGTLDLDYSGGERFRAHFAYSESRMSGLNQGVGGLTLPEAGLHSSATTRDIRTTMTEEAHGFMYRGGLVVSQTRSETRANSDALGVTVLGDFAAGGAPFTSNEDVRTTWTLKNVVQSALPWPSWSVGVAVSGSDNLKQEVPNAFGAFQFANLQAYTDALAGAGTGTRIVMLGNGTVRYDGKMAAPFAQKQLLHSSHFVVTAGLRGDYQSGYGILIAPRLSAAAQWHGFVLRTGGGLFVHNLPSSVFLQAFENDGSHLRQLMINGAPLTGSLAPPINSGQVIRSQLAPDLTQPREIMLKSSVERPLGKFTLGVEYTWTRDSHLLGSRRLPEGPGWMDLIESHRSSEKHRVHSRLGYRWRGQTVMAHYEWIQSRDNTSGPFSFPAQPNDLRPEWARSAGISPHNVSLAANFSLPGAIFLSLTEIWRGSAPYNITTGLDPANDGLYTDRGGLPRNSGNGLGYNSVAFYGHKRIALPAFLTGSHKRVFVDLGVQGDNLLGNKNYLSFGSIIGSPTFGQPLAASPGRSIRVWFSL